MLENNPLQAGFFIARIALLEMSAMEMLKRPAATISILVVEDDDLSREILSNIIPKKFPHTAVYTAVNGKAGLDLMRSHSPDIVITDIAMPEMDGARMADYIPSVKPDTKLIVITAASEKFVRKNFTPPGVTINHYLFKPVYYLDLFAAIEQCVAEVAGGRFESVVLADEHAEKKAEQAEEQRRHEGGGKAGYPEAVDQG